MEPESRTTVCLVEDNPKDARIMKRLLQTIDDGRYQFHHFQRKKTAIPEILSDPPSIVFVDYYLEQATGIDVIHQLRDEGYREPIVMVSGQGSESIAGKVTQEGGNGYLAKSDLNERSLQKCLDRVLDDSDPETKQNIQYEQLRRAARSDSLTGLHNRRHFRQLLEQEITRARRYELPLSLSMIDLDDFKSINDRFGHSSGDAILTRVADILSSSSRHSDEVARLGGDEFCLLLPHTDLTDATQVIQRIQKQIGSFDFLDDDQIDVQVTASFGLTDLEQLFHQDPTSPHWKQLLEFADKALYNAKNQGKNSIEKRKDKRTRIEPVRGLISTLSGKYPIEVGEFSEGGLQVRVPEPIPYGSCVYLTCESNEYFRSRLLGEIRWSTEGERGTYRTAIQIKTRADKRDLKQ